jgi:type 1 fimbriae regulatory protein FimB/type 1 fimbriae regulatory protein FimE
MGKPNLKLVVPSIENGTVENRPRPPRRRPNKELRSREYLTEAEVEQLIKAAGDNRHGHRDATLIYLGFRHGLRVAELVNLRWDAIDFNRTTIHVNRVKRSDASVHPLNGRELRCCDDCNASNNQLQPTCLFRSAARRSILPASAKR